MGSCISKCKPKKRSKEEDPCRRRHDKLVIVSKDPPPVAPEITIMPSSRPLSPVPSAASFSSFSYSANNKSATASSISSTASSLSSSSSSSYASSVSKDRSFSNDFLWSCVKENPHVIGLHADSKNVVYHNKIHSQNPMTTPSPARKKQTAVQEKTSVANAAPTPKKRARASSPTLVRQKSFRKEQNFAPTRGLRSPSPSRRFNSESNRIFPVKESYYSKPEPVSRGSNTVSSAPRRESFRAPTPSRKREVSAGSECSERRNDELLRHVSSAIDGKGRIDDDVVMEDINNPLIALDCFIFL